MIGHLTGSTKNKNKAGKLRRKKGNSAIRARRRKEGCWVTGEEVRQKINQAGPRPGKKKKKKKAKKNLSLD